MSLALYENNWPVLGYFYMPVTDDLFCATAEQQAFWNERPLTLVDRGDLSQESLMLTFSRFHQHYRSQFPGKIRALGSTGVHACYVAMGRADAAVVANESFKDLAAVRIIVESVGAKIYKADGSDFFLGDHVDGSRIDSHLVITSPANAESIFECLQRIQ
jgi:myo-inositol-1(or 4)-monophosphatase